MRAFLESTTQPHHVLAAAIRAAEILASELDKAGSLGRVGGAVYLHTLMATVPTAANAGFYAQIVAEKAILRRLVEAGTRIVQLGYGGNEGEAGGGEVDEIVDRAQAEITGSRSRSLCRVLGGVSLRFGLFTLRPRWGSPGVDPLGVRCARWAVVQRAPAAVHRVAARVRPERWSSPASKTDRSGPVIQHPVRSSRPRRRPTLTTHGDPLPSGTAAQVVQHRLPAQIERDDLPEPGGRGEVVVEGAVRARADQRVSGSGSGRRGACPGGTVRHERL
ncbi:MAG TPA: DnaB-like helicase N-terminal domain-containing protein [Kineosporiaceae bacterium]|nr:DnaB-like helicase N-terminal domain-containing protein [Kineosporiaceae bacterium]